MKPMITGSQCKGKSQTQNQAIDGREGIIIAKQKIKIRMMRMYRRKKGGLENLGTHGLLAEAFSRGGVENSLAQGGR